MIQAVRNAFTLPDLRRKLLFTLAILIIYRLAAHVPVPGVNQTALKNLLQGGGAGGQLVGLLDILSGGAVATFSVMAMGVYPYITASIIFQLLVPIIPNLEQMLKEEGEEGRRRLERYTYYLTVPLAALQAIGQVRLFGSIGGEPILPHFGFSGPQLLPTFATIAAMTAGTMFAIWLGELISEQGIGNGVSLIIFGGIVARIPQNVVNILVQQGVGGLLLFLAITAITVFVIVVVQEGQRRIPVQYGKRVRGRRVYGGQATHIPLRVNTAGMIPLIFAQSILTFPAIIAQFFITSTNPTVAGFARSVTNIFSGTSGWYAPMYFLMVVAFTYFYTDVLVQQQDLPGVLQRQGGFIPGIRPGRRTAEYITAVYRRITLVGALFLGAVAVLPFIVGLFVRSPQGTPTLLITSAGLLIVVGVVVDTMRQLEAQLLMRHYESFLR